MSEAYEIAASPLTLNNDTSLDVLAKAEIDMQIATAKKYPRSVKNFIDTALAMVTLNEEVATSCNYGLPRGGKIIEGASVRFAELIFSAWGNARAGARVVHEDSRFVTSQGVCHDLQSNTMITFEVKRRITNKHGKTFDDDMIGVTGNAAASIALRNAILKVVPKAFWQPIYNEARRVSMGDSKTLGTRRADALAIMLKFGVTLEMVLAKFELKGIEDITIEHLATLKACAVSIRDGAATAESLFESTPVATAKPAKGNEAVKEKLKPKAPAAEVVDTETGEITEQVAQEQAVSVKLPEFDINAHNLNTQAGIKGAVKELTSIIAMAEPEERGSVFLMNGGNDLLSAASRAGLGTLKYDFEALGIKLQ